MSSSPSSSGASATGDGGLILGVNKYSHDSAVCVLNASDGNCLFAGEKERLTRSKHDGGDTGDLVAHALESIGASLEDVRLVVSNNHHHRVAPFERRIPWAVATGAYPESYAAPENTLPAAAHAELSHHLAHAWSAASLAPFDSGLIVVMDGMGEAHGAMAKSEAAAVALQAAQLNNRAEHDGAKPGEEEYYNDLRLMRELGAGGEMAEGAKVPGGGNPGFQQVPQELLPHEAYREAESAYTFVPGLGEGLCVRVRDIEGCREERQFGWGACMYVIYGGERICTQPTIGSTRSCREVYEYRFELLVFGRSQDGAWPARSS